MALNLSLNAGSGGSPTALQWSLTYSQTDVASINVTAGNGLTAAGKTISCANQTGSTTCLASGTNNNAIGNGAVAVVTVMLAPSSGLSVPIGLTKLMGAKSDGTAMAISGTGGTIAVQTSLPAVSQIQCNPATLSSGSSAICTVTLSKAAPTGARSVTLSDNSASLTVPASVTVPVGATSATFNANTASIASDQTVTVTGAYGGASVNTSVNLVAANVVSLLTCSPTTLGSNASSTCTVTLSKAATTGGASVTLTDNSSALTVPASVTVSSGVRTASFNASTASIASDQTVTVTATYGGVSVSSSISLVAPTVVSSLACSPTTLAPNASSTCTVTLSKAATTGGASVTLSDDSSALTVPGSVTVSAGATTATFNASTGSLSTNQSATITASFGGTSSTATLSLQSSSSIPTGLLAAYGFEEGKGKSVGDSSGNSITGTVQQATWTESGKYGSALSFNGTNSYVDLGSPASLRNTGSMTLSAWVFITGTPADDGDIISLSTNTAGWQLKTSPDTGVRTFGIAMSASSSGHTQRYSKTVVAQNTWYHVAGVYNASARTLDIYVNGVLDNGTLVGTIPAAQFLPSENVTIGKRSAGGFYFIGTIDEVRAYNRAVSVTEIQTDMATAISTYSMRSRKKAPALPVTVTTQPVNPGTVTSATSVERDTTPSRSTTPQLSCVPKTVDAGGTTTCQLRVPASPSPAALSLKSSVAQVQIPAFVYARPNQSIVIFEAFVGATAKQQTATVTAAIGDNQAEESFLIMPATGPVLSVPEKQIGKFGSPVEFTVTASDASNLPIQLTAAGLPAGAAFDPASGRFSWVPTAAQGGRFETAFTAANSARQTSTAAVAIEVDSGKPVLESSDTPSCSPNTIARLTGKWLAEGGTALADPSGVTTDLGGTRVKVNGQYVPVLAASATNVRFLCPAVEPGTPLSVSVEAPAGDTGSVQSVSAEAAPSILSLDSTISKQGLIFFPETTDLVMQPTSQAAAHPAQTGDEILIWATGLGSGIANPTGTILVKLGDIYTQAESVDAIAGHAGLYSIQVRVPAGVAYGSAVPVQIQLTASGGQQLRSNSVTAAFEPAIQ